MRQANYVLGLAGSPRKGANSTILLEEVLEGAKEAGGEVEKIILNNLAIRSCQACGGCNKEGRCVINDDMQKLYPLLEKAGHIVLATPIYFYAASGVAKAAIDRSQAMWVRKYYLDAPPGPDKGKGYLLAVGATKGSRLFECAQLSMRYYFDALNVEYAGELLVRGVEEAGEIRGRKELLQEARQMGRNMVPKQSA